MLKSINTVQLDIVLSRQLNYITVFVLLQEWLVKGAINYVHFSYMDYEKRWY